MVLCQNFQQKKVFLSLGMRWCYAHSKKLDVHYHKKPGGFLWCPFKKAFCDVQCIILDLKPDINYFTYLKIQKWICDILERRWRIQKLFLDNF